MTAITTIILKHSDTPGRIPQSLAHGELAVNLPDQRLFIGGGGLQGDDVTELTRDATPTSRGYMPANDKAKLDTFGPNGNAKTADRLTAPFNLNIEGYAMGTVPIDGSADITINVSKTVTVLNTVNNGFNSPLLRTNGFYQVDFSITDLADAPDIPVGKGTIEVHSYNGNITQRVFLNVPPHTMAIRSSDNNGTTWTQWATLTPGAAHRLITPRSIKFEDTIITPSTMFDGSADIIIPVSSIDSSKLTGTAPINVTGRSAMTDKLASPVNLQLNGYYQGSTTTDLSGNIAVDLTSDRGLFTTPESLDLDQLAQGLWAFTNSSAIKGLPDFDNKELVLLSTGYINVFSVGGIKFQEVVFNSSVNIVLTRNTLANAAWSAWNYHSTSILDHTKDRARRTTINSQELIDNMTYTRLEDGLEIVYAEVFAPTSISSPITTARVELPRSFSGNMQPEWDIKIDNDITSEYMIIDTIVNSPTQVDIKFVSLIAPTESISVKLIVKAFGHWK